MTDNAGGGGGETLPSKHSRLNQHFENNTSVPEAARAVPTVAAAITPVKNEGSTVCSSAGMVGVNPAVTRSRAGHPWA